MTRTDRSRTARQTRRRRALAGIAVAALATLALAVLGLAGPAASQGLSSEPEAPTVAVVTGVDATGENVEVSVLRSAYDVAADEVTITEGGEPVDRYAVSTASELQRPVEVVYVLDLDTRTMADGTLRSMALALLDSVGQLPADTRIGLVAAGEQATIETRLGTDRQRLRSDLQNIQAGRGAALYDAVRLAGESFSERPGTVRSVIVLSGGPDIGSTWSLADAEAALVQSGAQLIWVPSGAGDEGLDRLVTRTGGTALAIADADAVESVVATATAIAADRLLVTFPASVEDGTRSEVTLTVAGQPLRFSYPAGLSTTTRLQLTPGRDGDAIDLGLFGQPVVLYVSIALAFLAISGGLWALASLFAGGETSLDQRLARYSEGGDDEDDEEQHMQDVLVQTALIQRAVDMTESFAERRGFLTRIEELFERANLPVRAGEGLFFLSMLVVVVFGAVFAVTSSLFAGLIVAIVSAIIAFAVVNFIAARRLKRFNAQLPDTLQLLAGTLRAGYSLPQGIDAVADEIADPMSQELRRAMTETQLGRELEESLASVAERLTSEDFAWVVMAIGIQREVGGNLAEVLLTVSDTMIQRERLHREVNALTAEGRVSAGILSMLPPGLGLVMWVMNPEYLGVLFSRTIGLIMLAMAVVAGLVGLAWMKKVITIDV